MINLLKSITLSLLITTSAFAQKTLTVNDVCNSKELKAKGTKGFNAMKDGIHYTELSDSNKVQRIIKYDLETGERIAILVDGNAVKLDGKSIGLSDYTFSVDETKLLLKTEDEAIFRRSSKAINYVYDLKTGKIAELSKNGKQMFATFSPMGNKVAFVRNNNLFIKDLDVDKEVQVTIDGKYNEIK
jgi:dipeptidyl-peptidase 4